MITRATIFVGIVLSGVLQSKELTAQAQPGAEEQTGMVYLHETFEDYEIGSEPEISQLQRAQLVTVIAGEERVGSGKVARFDDLDTEKGGALEYNVGPAGLSNMYIEFDAINNTPDRGDKSSAVIFGVAPWGAGKSLGLNAKAKRAFGFEMYQQKYLKLRIGDELIASKKYEPEAPFNVKIWVNDHDGNTLSYQRPDNGEAATLNPDSVVVWVNDSLLGDLEPAGVAMNGEVTGGDEVIGRVGLSSSSTKFADFLFDNLHIEGPSGESKAAEPTATATEEGTATPVSMPGAETMSYRDGENAMNLFVYKPADWQAGDKRSAFIHFFGGGWTKGSPQNSAATAAWAAENGMVGIAPDYRTKNRFDTSPLASVDDGRAAFCWVLEHAEELGIDPTRIVVGGSSSGGHIALWTAIENSPPGSDPATSPKSKPAAVLLTSAVTDTSPETGYTPARFGDDALALSPIHQLDSEMPPVLMFHAAFDDLVHYRTAVALHDKLVANQNRCELVTVPQGGHGFTSDQPKWKTKVRTKMVELFNREGLLPAVK